MGLKGNPYRTIAQRRADRAAWADFDADTPVESNRPVGLPPVPGMCDDCDHVHRPHGDDARCWALLDDGKRCRCGEAVESRHTNHKFRIRVVRDAAGSRVAKPRTSAPDAAAGVLGAPTAI